MKEVREWIQLAFVVLGGAIALVAFFQNLRQRRVENALKFVSLFRDGLRDGDLGHWHDLFISSSELAGANHGQYQVAPDQYSSIADFFSEGAPDGHAVARMASALDVVCHQVTTNMADARTVYYELGQLLDTMHDWLAGVKSATGEKTLLEQAFPSIRAFFMKYNPRKRDWPSRVYEFIE